jgi:hypothetical protein
MAFSIGRILGRFFGSATSQSGMQADSFTDPVTHDDYTIKPESFLENGQWITAARISRQFPDGVREHEFVRADIFPSQGGANECAVRKARTLIDQMGDNVFGSD